MGRHGRRLGRGGGVVNIPFPLLLRRAAYGINSILYQRGIYPPETFTRVQKYGLTLLVTTDPELANYLNNVTEQMKGAGRRQGLPCGVPAAVPRALSDCRGFLQSGCTSASCSAWWWSSPASRAARSWSGGSLTSSVTKLQRMTSEYHGPSTPALSCPEYRCRHRINATDLFLQTFLSALPSVCLQTSHYMIEHTTIKGDQLSFNFSKDLKVSLLL